jgi:hypothetical protein
MLAFTSGRSKSSCAASVAKGRLKMKRECGGLARAGLYVAVALSLSSTRVFAEGGKLNLTNVRATYGLLGPARAEGRILPGDILCLEFDIGGITVAPDGKVQYSMSLEALDAQGKVVYGQNATGKEAFASLGGKSVPAQAHLDIGLDQPAGDYTVNVTVTDRATMERQSFTHKLQVSPAEFGIVQLKTTSDPDGMVPAGLVGTGQSIWVSFAAVRFNRDQTTKQPNIQFEMRILDEDGKPTLAKPETGTINRDVPAGDQLLGGQFPISVNRPGKFVVQLQTVDRVAGKTATLTFPLTVQPRH